jgi:hypothetical protein
MALFLQKVQSEIWNNKVPSPFWDILELKIAGQVVLIVYLG